MRQKGGQKYAGDVGQMTTAGSVSKGGDIIWDDLDHDGVLAIRTDAFWVMVCLHGIWDGLTI